MATKKELIAKADANWRKAHAMPDDESMKEGR